MTNRPTTRTLILGSVLLALPIGIAAFTRSADSLSQPIKEPFLPITPKKPTSTGLSKGEFTVSIEGAKQGRFKGEGSGDAVKDKLIGLAFEYEIKTPRDPASGAATGKRQHQPIVFTKEWGAASPQLFQAAATNESLKTVVFEFYPAAPGGAADAFYNIKLTNAAISSIRQRTVDGRFLEEVSLSFAKIEVEHKGSKTSASDDASK